MWGILTCLVSIRTQAGLLLQTRIKRNWKRKWYWCKIALNLNTSNKTNDLGEQSSVLLYKRVVAHFLHCFYSFAVFQKNLQETFTYCRTWKTANKLVDNEDNTFKIGWTASSGSKMTDLEQIFSEPLVCLCIKRYKKKIIFV